jgi:hypothetical protein
MRLVTYERNGQRSTGALTNNGILIYRRLPAGRYPEI